MQSAAALLVLALLAQAPGAAESPAATEPAPEAAVVPAPGNPLVVFDTTLGQFTVELFADKAPETTANIVSYVESGFYDETIFHRVVRGYIIQGGGFNEALRKLPTREPVTNEADNRISNERGTLSMARGGDPHGATSQFFINLSDNENLDHRGKDPMNWGYAVFGRVIEGMDVVDAIGEVRTAYRDGHRNVPVEPVVVRKATVKKEDQAGE